MYLSCCLLLAGDKIFMVCHFEAPVPSSMYITELVQDPDNGQLSALWTEAIDWSAYGGIWVPCAGKQVNQMNRAQELARQCYVGKENNECLFNISP